MFKFDISKSDVGNSGAFVAVLSSNSIDRTGDRVMPSAFAAFKGMKRPLLVAHEDGIPVGTAHVDRIEGDRVIAKGQLFLANSAEARAAHDAMKEGVLSLSWRGRIAEGGASHKGGIREINKLANLDEITLTAMPANSDARILTVAKSAALAMVERFGEGMGTSGARINFSVPEAKSLTDGLTPPGSTREQVRMATIPDRDPAYVRFADLWTQQVAPGSAAYGLQVSDGNRSTANTPEGDTAQNVEPQFSLANVGTLKWHTATCKVGVEILSDWAGLAAFLEQHLDSTSLDMRDAAAIANAMTGADAGATHTSVREAAVAALAACAANGYLPTMVAMHPGDYFREFGDDPAATTPIIAGVPVYPIVGIALGTVIAGARMCGTLTTGASVNFDISASGDDLTKGLRTLRIFRASHFFVRQGGGIAHASKA